MRVCRPDSGLVVEDSNDFDKEQDPYYFGNPDQDWSEKMYPDPHESHKSDRIRHKLECECGSR